MRGKAIRGLLAAILALGACSPAPSPTPTPASTAPSAASPTPAIADTIRIAMPATMTPTGVHGPPTGMGPLSNSNFQQPRPYSDPGPLLRMVYGALYKFDDHLAPVPDLASEPCRISPDSLTFTCRLVNATFHDGTPLTAEDVAFTYDLALSRACSFQICFEDPDHEPGIHVHLRSVEVVDPHTVRFDLKDRWAPFITSVLPVVLIDSKKLVTSQFDAFIAKARTVPAPGLLALAEQIRNLAPGDRRACERLVRGAETAVRSVGLEPYDPAVNAGAPCAHVADLERQLDATLGATSLKGLDAIAAAYPVLPFNLHPVGTGPWRVTSSTPGKEIKLEAFDGYHGGRPRTSSIVFDLSTPASGDLSEPVATGAADIEQLPEPVDADTWAAFKRLPNLRFVRYAMAGYVALQFNLRPGRLFADPALREALERCLDRPAAVEAATGGLGIPIASDVAPSSWAFDPELEIASPDPAGARRVIEALGWQAGADGVYAKDGKRLATAILVRADFPDRVQFATTVASQARACGMDLTVSRQSFDDLIGMISTFPHVVPGSKTPFDVYLGGWLIGMDPGDGGEVWGSDRITTAKHPDDLNYIGFSDPEVDRLFFEGNRTYAIEDRAPIYRRIQAILAAKRPYIFGYAFGGKVALSPGVGSADGDLDLASPFWNWKLSDLVLNR
jgi:ABC-type transport system substrate-binding protein